MVSEISVVDNYHSAESTHQSGIGGHVIFLADFSNLNSKKIKIILLTIGIKQALGRELSLEPWTGLTATYNKVSVCQLLENDFLTPYFSLGVLFDPI